MYLGTKKLIYKITGIDYDLLLFWCPACNQSHHYSVHESHKNMKIDKVWPDGITRSYPCWFYNNMPDCPTFSPSLKYLTEPYCHCTITNGKIYYHGDSPNRPNETIDMIPFPDGWNE